MADILVVGNYCHDTIYTRRGTHRWAGGSSLYIGAVLTSLDAEFDVVAHVGADFAYEGAVTKPARVIEGRRTTACIDDYRSGARLEKFEALCAPIRPDDLPEKIEIGLACAIAGEILPETFNVLRERSAILIADAQGLLRAIDDSGRVRLVKLTDTDFAKTASRLDFIKANEEEAKFLDIQELRKSVGVIITREKKGCIFLDAKGDIEIPGYPVDAIDPTGAGDSFTGGFSYGLQRGWSLNKALRLANLCGSAAVRGPGPAILAEIDLEGL
ncbi:MAG: carbohydrate kinase [Elusimicrobia bacterium]|nr:MAG: carbohydrate kinase [Elusimicrobiota bacterium]